MSLDLIRHNLAECERALNELIGNQKTQQHILAASELISNALKKKNKIYSCGNGGSMCDAMHFAEELSGQFRTSRPALGAMAISDPAHMTCSANDFGFDSVFSRFVEAHGRAGDVLLAISTSGKSPNILKAAQAAKAAGMTVVALTGRPDSVLGLHADIDICTPGFTSYSDRIQELHIKVIHILIALCEKAVFNID